MADSDGKVNGRWTGSYQRLFDGTELVPGETVVPVGVFELREGSYWVPADDEAEAAFAAWQLEDSDEEPNPVAEPEPVAEVEAEKQPTAAEKKAAEKAAAAAAAANTPGGDD